MRRGEIWSYQGIRHQRTLLIVSADALNADRPIAVEVTPHGPEGASAMLTVKLGEHGYARCRRLGDVDPGRMHQRVGIAEPHALDAVDAALRVLLELP